MLALGREQWVFFPCLLCNLFAGSLALTKPNGLVDRADALTAVISSSDGQGADAIKSQTAAPDTSTASLPTNVAWFHVPRTGSSFMYNLLSLVPGLCNENSLLEDGSESDPLVGEVTEICPAIMIPDNYQAGDHCASEQQFASCAEYAMAIDLLPKGASLMGMFRQPEQRMISDYNWALDQPDAEWTQDASELGTMEEYAKLHAGCAMRKLLHEEPSGGHCNGGLPNFKPEDNMDEAIELLEQFSFVGIHEEWALSMCLFNKMFGTPCRPEQVWDSASHKTSKKTGDYYDTSDLKGWVDEYDGPIYQRAQDIFAENVKRYGVSADSCKSCYDEMGWTE